MSENPDNLLDLAYRYYQRQSYPECSKTLQAAAERIDHGAQFLYRLGVLYTYIGNHQSAFSSLQEAVKIDPNNAAIHFQLGESLRFSGDFDASLKAYEQAIELNPHSYESHLERSRLYKQSQQSNHIDEIETLLNQGVRSKRGAAKLLYALAKEYEDLEEYRRAFINMGRGATLQRQLVEYRPETDQRLVDDMILSYPYDITKENPDGYQSTEPIFIIGMPRTGTTLVERILGSHCDVFAAGELYNLAGQLQDKHTQITTEAKDITFLSRELIENSITSEPGALGLAYIESTRPLTGQTKHFTDKLPVNFYYCGLINRALPNAKIIHIERNPMDTCLAVYKHLFASGAYPFSYNLHEIALYYLGYRKLMRHWHKVMPGKILDVSYESLVENFEQECRRIFVFCDLEPDGSHTEFHKNETPTATASAVQVRSPVYNSALARWKNYEDYLNPLMDFLIKNGVDIQ